MDAPGRAVLQTEPTPAIPLDGARNLRPEVTTQCSRENLASRRRDTVTKAWRPPGRGKLKRHHDRKEEASVARVEIGGRREGQEVWAGWIDGRVQGDREFLKVAGLDPGTRFEDPHAFVELIEGLLDEGSESVVIDVPERPA